MYPTRVLFKSCKAIPVMLCGMCLGRTYGVRKRLSVLLIALAPVPLGAGRLAWMTLNIAAGLIVMFAGLASSVEELYSSSSGFFDGECRLEYTYSPESPDDPCFLSGLPHEAGR